MDLCLNNCISVISCHTNLDLTDEFGNLAIAELLGAKDAKHLDGAVCGVYYELDSEEPVTLKDYCRKVASDLKCSGIITINDPQNKVNKVFIQGGSFDEDSVDTILKNGIDTVISGEIKHHICVGLGQNINVQFYGHSSGFIRTGLDGITYIFCCSHRNVCDLLLYPHQTSA